MKQKQAKDLENLEKQHQLFLSGQYNTLFNDLSLNLPFRFFAYSDPESLDLFFVDTFRELNKIKTNTRNQSVWPFDQVIKILAPHLRFYSRNDELEFLVHKCAVPEGHLSLDGQKQVTSEIFPQKSILLSRYAMLLIVNKLNQESSLFESDLRAPLLTEPATQQFTLSQEMFLDEARLMFARQYFADPIDDCEILIQNTWTWIRGEQLRHSYASTMKKLRGIIMKNMKYATDDAKINEEIARYKERFYNTDIDEAVLAIKIKDKLQAEFDDANAERFKQKFIFDTLFESSQRGNFRNQYDQALESFGYEFTRRDDQTLDDRKKWRRGDLVAPSYPGAYFRPDLSFFMTWAINNFCEFIDAQPVVYKNRRKWFELLTNKFFTTVKDALITESKTKFNGKLNLVDSDKFINQHDYHQAHEVMRQMFIGTGRSIRDRKTDRPTKEIPGAYAGWRTHDLFTDDDRYCVQSRQIAERNLDRLHKQYLTDPTVELAKQIGETENQILYENMALYGQNFQGYVNVPVTLDADGSFKSRPIIGPEKVVMEFRLPDIKQTSFNPVAKQTTIFDAVFDPLYQAHKNRGLFITREIYGKNKEDWHLDKNGIFQTVNPMVANPKSMRKYHGQIIPSLHIENFRMCNFLFESDILSMDRQLELAQWLVSIGVASRVVDSGNKSIHILITIQDEPKTPDEYTWLFYHLGIKLGLVERTWNKKALKYEYTGVIDLSCNKPNRSTRRAGAMRPIKTIDQNGTETVNYIEQKLLHDSDNVYDYKWRGEYMADMVRTQQLKKSAYNIQQGRCVYFKDSQDINKFVTAYAAKNNIPLTFEQGIGHQTGCTIIGAAKKAGFDGQTIKNWLKQNCARYDELCRNWQGILR